MRKPKLPVHKPTPKHVAKPEPKPQPTVGGLLIDEMLTAIEQSAPWLAKMIAEGGHKTSTAPEDCENALRLCEAVLEKASRVRLP